MQQVNQQWLRWLLYALIGVDILIVTIFFATRFVFTAFSAEVGITTPITIMAGAHLFYAAFMYRFIEYKNSWYANMISAALFGILIAASMASEQPLPYFRVLFVLYSFFYAMNGLFVPLAGVTIAWSIFALNLGVATPTDGSTLANVVTNSIATLGAIVGWIIFKPRYTSVGAQPNAHLSSLLAQEKFKSSIILESITDGVIITDTNGTVQVINNSAALMLGWEQKEALQLDYRSLVQPFQEKTTVNQTPEETAIATCARTQRATQKVSLLMTKNQRRTYVDIVASPVLEEQTDQAGNKMNVCVGVVAILRNVDRQKRDEEQRSDFISTASHEMRTPVASIQGFLELALNEKVATVDEKARGYLVKAHEASKHLGRLFQDLLTASKSEDGRLVNNPTIIEVGEVLGQLVEHARLAAEKKKLQVAFETTQSTDKAIAPLLYIHADPERFREVITNLIDNAIKYTEHGMITIGASLKEKSVVVRVSDTGMGIDAEDIPHLFQKFYRTDNTATRAIGGTGLGLYITKQIVEMMGGQVWVESTPGAGSTFYVELPRVSPESVIEQSGS